MTYKKRKLLALVLALSLAVFLFGIGVCAEDVVPTSEPTESVTADGGLLGATGEGTGSEDGESSSAPAETTAAPAETTAAPTETTAAPAETTTAPAETTTAPAETTTEVAKPWIERNMTLVITLGIIVALIIIFFIVYFSSSKFNEKVKKFFKDYKSEFKKLVWPTREQLVKNSTVVIIALILFGLVLGLLDFGLNKGVSALRNLVEFLKPVS